MDMIFVTQNTKGGVMDMIAKSPDNPTGVAYGELDEAYAYYNSRLFNDALPRCLMTLHNTGKRSAGYFSSKRFIRLADGTVCTDEIAMNPTLFQNRPLEEVLSTLAHEQCHLWQDHFGTPSRGKYHNKEWAAQMRSIGLMPSNTGKPGGRQTGQQMSHYTLPDGPFARVTAELLATGFVLSWGQRPLPEKPRLERPVKYTCLACGLIAKAKPDVRLTCTVCADEMLAV